MVYDHEDDDKPTAPLPFKFEICGQCSGHGRSSLYMGAFTEDDMDQQGPDFREEYMAGTFDRTCESCDGDGKVKVPDRARMTKAQRDALDLDEQIDAEDRAMAEAERRMGC